MNMFFGLVLHMYAFFSLIFPLNDFSCMYFANGPPNFSNGTSLKNYYYISLTVYCIFFFSQLAFCQLKTLQLSNTNHMYI